MLTWDFWRSLNLTQDLTRCIIWFALVSVTALVGSLAYQSGYLNIAATAIVQHWVITAVLLISFVLFILSLIRFSKARKLSNYYPQQEFDFRILEKTITYDSRNRHQITYKRKYKLRALRNGLDSYRDKFHWTGGEEPKIGSNTRNHRVVIIGKRNIWQVFEIRFGKTLAKNDMIESEVVWHLTDTGEKSVPFISANIEEPTDKVSLSVSFPIELGITEVVEESGVSLGAKVPYSSKAVALEHGAHVWTFQPKLFHSYALNWSWPG